MSLIRFLSALSLLAITGCGAPDDTAPTPSSVSQLVDLTAGAFDTTDTAAQLLGAHKKEYHVLRFSERDSSEEIESRLNLLGQEGWDCNPANTAAGTELQFICKRQSTTISHKITELGSKLFSRLTEGKNEEKKQDSSRF